MTLSLAINGMLAVPVCGVEAAKAQDTKLTVTEQIMEEASEELNEESVLSPEETPETPPPRKIIDIYVRPDVAIFYKGQEMAFYSSQKDRVYPIIYNGSTYLPLRAVSALMERAIEWDNYSKSIFIGKTFQDPAGITRGSTYAAVAMTGATPPEDSLRVKATLRPDVQVFYEFQIKKFKDASGKSVYPIIYEGSSYLPLRSISLLMKEEVVWDNVRKQIIIGQKDTEGEGSNTDNPPKVTNSAIDQMSFIFMREKEIYNEVSEKIVEIIKVKDINEKQAIAFSISEDYRAITQIALNLKKLNTNQLTPEELAIYNSLSDFTMSMEMYLLVIENVAYMDVNDQDFSLLAEALLHYALDSQEKMGLVDLESAKTSN